ncbi:MAG: hypothetical protein COB53_09675 [Elusimicrobia bacterium]|nr:MAG: hypothetical protein COB53_09675 [Elusimicrobiota bacterium]
MALYRFSNLKTPLNASEADILLFAATALRIPPKGIRNLRVVKRSIDARKKPKILFVLQIEFSWDGAAPKGADPIERSSLDIPVLRFPKSTSKAPVVVVGAGPAGLFAALALAEAGRKTILLERGKPVETRMKDIGALRASGVLDPESNVCFGEGGAGAYTDGKLYTRVKHPFVRSVFKTLVEVGANPGILVDAHPHLGTEKLVAIVKRLRERILKAGGEVRFESRVESLLLNDGAAVGVKLSSGEEISADVVVLAIGHSARDTLESLERSGVRLEAKPFAVGVRAEHPQELINRSQYGAKKIPVLGAASYALTHQAGKRGIYSFCMCPGGFVVPSPTEPGLMAVNGMSNSGRSTQYANSGVVVQVSPEDLPGKGPLVGIAFQRQLEAAAFKAVSKEYHAPAIRISDFLKGKASGSLAGSNFRPGLQACDIRELLPKWVSDPLVEGVRAFSRKLKGYDSREGNLIAVESRTSSPIRMTREKDFQAVGIAGLYPVGEGAGYAGGIVSAAVDGLRAAEAILT